MYSVLTFAAILTTVLLQPIGVHAEPLRSARAVARQYTAHFSQPVPFELTARVTYMRRHGTVCAIGVEDESGCVAMSVEGAALNALALQPGDKASFRGLVRAFSQGKSHAILESHTLLSHGPRPEPVNASISDLLDGKMDYRLVRIRGLLRDAVTSETNPDWIILVICASREQIYVSVPKTAEIRNLDHLIGSRVSAVGICAPTDISPRGRFGPTFKVAAPEDVTADADSANAESKWPDISDIGPVGPAGLLSLGRHSTSGKVVAVWNNCSGVLKTQCGDYVGLEFVHRPIPRCGQSIRAIGLPESDLYRINLVRVSWEPIPSLEIPEDRTRSASLEEIIADQSDNPLVNNLFYGKPVTLTGEALNSLNGRTGETLLLRNGNRVCEVDVGSCGSAGREMTEGSVIEATGVCILTSSDARHSSQFPRLNRLLLVTRSTADVRIISRPPWWTPIRLAIAVGLLLVLLVAILVWNASLRRLVIRKSTALLREQAAKLEETLKIDERTRLAAELHDYLAQNLTVVSYQISAAESALQKKRDDAADYLANADRMLRSCRVDLRRCLWDLRNDTLDEPNFARAIIKAVSPVMGNAALHVRFDVRRSKLSDSTAHAILSICRELVANAILHGKAKTIRIAGELEDGVIGFSVRDDGIGFDPSSRSGQASGHFGLDGIGERVKRIGGTLDIESAPGCGTRVAVTISNGESK